jgi:hypothetical protein
MEVVRAINKVSDNKALDATVSQLVPKLWPTLEAELEKIPDTEPADRHKRTQHEILEELVTGVRGLNSRMRDIDPEYSDKERFIRRRGGARFHPKILQELIFMSSELDDAPTSLLLVAGFLRQDYPWLAEILSEAYREIQYVRPDEAERVYHRLRRTIRHLTHGPMMFELSGNPKEAMMLLEELPRIVDMALSQFIEPRSSIETKEENEQKM